MNQFMASAQRMLTIHGNPVTYKAVTKGAYNIETGSTVNSETDYSVTAYKKQLKSNQFQFPNLINKELAEFLICPVSMQAIPAPKDYIQDGTSKYVVESIKEYRTNGEIVLYSIVTSKV